MKCSYLFIVLAAGVLSSCYEEDALAPTEGTEEIFKLPQGNHDYDTRIVEWFECYGFYGLYIFDEKDIYWANQEWLEGGKPEVSTIGTEKGQPGDPEYVGCLVDMFEKLLLNHYPGKFIQKGMPLRVFLCSNLWDYTYDRALGEYISTRIWMYEGWDNIAVNGASSYIKGMTRQDQLDFSRSLNAYLLQRIITEKLVTIPDEFYAESSYDKTSFSGAALFENGYLERAEYSVRNGVTKDQYKAFDLQTYVKLAACSSDYLENGELEDISYEATPSLSGLFKRSEATKVKKKYDIVVEAFRKAGIDMEKIQTPPVVEY